ncbi:MAG: multicopper oxidase domain-containing protein, partial [Bacteroidota bacterium]
IPRPDKIGMMKLMAKMDMRMGAPALKANPSKDDRYEMSDKFGMQMDMEGMKGDMSHDMTEDKIPGMKMDGDKAMDGMPGMNHGKVMDGKPRDTMSREQMTGMGHGKMDHGGMKMDAGTPSDRMPAAEMMGRAFDYSYLRALKPTTYDPDAPVREILLNLTGNMNRYVWSFNGVGLSETDKIAIKGGEVTRITFNNLTMMHHPLHLHGHFFRVINKHGEYSPLKHTVNVPPMQKVTIEFYGDEYGDWFFHCHVLYHMMGGMARIFSYGTPRDERLAAAPLRNLVAETDQYFTWGLADVGSHMTGLSLTSSNVRNQFNLLAEIGYNQNFEAEVTYERYIYDWVTVFGGVNVENGQPESFDNPSVTAVAGIRWFTPYMFNVDARVDYLLRPRLSIGRSLMLFPRLSAFGYYEYTADFGIVGRDDGSDDFQGETVWSAGLEYMLGRQFSLMGSYDNRFGAGGGLSWRF